MNKSTLPVGIKSLAAWWQKGQLSFDHAVQRSLGQWSLLQKSLLIHSLLEGYPTPPCYFLKAKNDAGETVYSVLDGKQRITSIFEFMRGEFALHSATPPCMVDGAGYSLANRKFEELTDDLRDEVSGYRLSIFCLEDCTSEEVEEVFTRLNNATPLSAVQKCRSVMSAELAGWAKEICKMDFFQHGISLTLAQLRREADLEVLLQAMLLLDARHEGYDDWKGISTAEVMRYCHHIRHRYNEDKRRMMYEIIDFLGVAFKEQHKFLKKSNVPMVVVLAKVALEHRVGADRFWAFIDAFSSSACADYEANTGSGNVKRAKTEGRLRAIAVDFEAYFGLDDVHILRVEADSGNPDVADDVPSPEADFPDGDSFDGSGDAEFEPDVADAGADGEDAEEAADGGED